MSRRWFVPVLQMQNNDELLSCFEAVFASSASCFSCSFVSVFVHSENCIVWRLRQCHSGPLLFGCNIRAEAVLKARKAFRLAVLSHANEDGWNSGTAAEPVSNGLSSSLSLPKR